MTLVSEGSSRASRLSDLPTRNVVGVGLFVLLVLSAGVYFREGLVALATAWQTPEYSHGPLIPLLSGFLFLRHLKEVPVHLGPVNDRWPGVLLILAALALGAAGKFARIDDVVAYALIGFIGGVVLVSFGWRRGYPFWPAVLHLVFMLPLPGMLYWKVSIFLQAVSSQIGVMIIQAMNIPVFLEGNIIDLGESASCRWRRRVRACATCSRSCASPIIFAALYQRAGLAQGGAAADGGRAA
jgi:hypothetical protein